MTETLSQAPRGSFFSVFGACAYDAAIDDCEHNYVAFAPAKAVANVVWDYDFEIGVWRRSGKNH